MMRGARTPIEDPRLGNVPLRPGCRVTSHQYKNEYMISLNDDEFHVWYGPWMSPEALRERGLDL